MDEQMSKTLRVREAAVSPLTVMTQLNRECRTYGWWSWAQSSQNTGVSPRGDNVHGVC